MKPAYVQGSKEEVQQSTNQMMGVVNLGYTFTQEEKTQYGDLFRQMLRANYVAFAEHFGQRPALFKTVLGEVFGQGRLTPRAGDAIEQADEISLKSFIFGMPQLAGLTLYDRMTLITNNYPAVYFLSCAICMDRKELMGYFIDLAAYLKRHKEAGKLDQTRMEALKQLEVFSNQDQAPEPGSTDFSFYDNSRLKSLDIEKQSSLRQELQGTNQSLQSVAQARVRKSKKIHTTDPIITLLSMLVSITNVGLLKLQHQEKAQEVQDKHAWMLHKYLKTYYPGEANKRYHQLISAGAKFLDMYKPKNAAENIF